MLHSPLNCLSLFFFNNPATTEIYTLSLHDALPFSTSPPRRTSTAASTVRRTLSRLTSSASRRCSTRSEEHTSELQSHVNLVCRLLLEKKKYYQFITWILGKANSNIFTLIISDRCQL